MSVDLENKIFKLKLRLKTYTNKSNEWESMNNFSSGNSGNPYKRAIEDIKLKIKTLKTIKNSV